MSEHEEEKEDLLKRKARLRAQLIELSEGAMLVMWSEGRDEADRGTAAHEREQSGLLSEQLRAQLDAVENALRRLNDGSYGTCLMCGGAIGEGRLEALPTAQQCVACAS